ncbi:ejaculatory bulb-specific protein 3-like [Cotesia typhae]|uniref:ejaculatory bulb-specific protein 3-like n=1 Tax=Cotesia typhae TaxID=2053667 RepID=UPI003D699F71
MDARAGINALANHGIGLLVRGMHSRLVGLFWCHCAVMHTSVILLLVVCASHCYQPPPAEAYMTRWDKLNLDLVLENKKLLHNYYNCLMNKGPCPPDGRELKRALPEALSTECAKCSKSQKEGAIKIIKYLREYKPKEFGILANKYDPDGVYRRKYFASEDTNNLT